MSGFPVYANQNPYRYIDPDGEYAVLAALAVGYAAFELASTAYDVYDAGRTLADPNSSGLDKGLSIGGLAAGVLLPGPGRAYKEGAELGLGVTKGAPSLKQQAKDIRHNLNGDKPTVTIKTEQNGKHLHYDLTGAGHKGVETPHMQHSKANTDNNGVTRYKKQKGREDVHSMSQQDIRTVRRYLERKDR